MATSGTDYASVAYLRLLGGAGSTRPFCSASYDKRLQHPPVNAICGCGSGACRCCSSPCRDAGPFKPRLWQRLWHAAAKLSPPSWSSRVRARLGTATPTVAALGTRRRDWACAHAMRQRLHRACEEATPESSTDVGSFHRKLCAFQEYTTCLQLGIEKHMMEI
ncbi:hypothetical protein SEVIR_5G198621v4 [Setaria viridis]